jgi:hypothetical protein
MQNKDKSIRFIDSRYNELFRIPDGGSIRVEYPNEPGRFYTAECKYMDDYHTSINGFPFHICQFAELMEKNGCTYRPDDTHSLEVQANEMTVLVVEPMKEPQIKTIPKGLESLQHEVGGMIEVVYPFEDNVGLIVNEEGKLDGLPLNRGLHDEDGHLYDIIAGTFLVVGLTEDDFCSLTAEQLGKYAELYQHPQIFVRIGEEIAAVPVEAQKPSVRDKLQEKKAEAAQTGQTSPKPKKEKTQDFDLS